MNLMPIGCASVRWTALNFFGYPSANDDDFKTRLVWGPILGIKYGNRIPRAFRPRVPFRFQKLLGNGDSPQPVLVFGFTDVFGGGGLADVRLHFTWYWLDKNENSADKMLFPIRPEFSTGRCA